MHKRKRKLWLLLLAILSLVGFIYLLLSFSPSFNLQVLSFNLPVIYLFFAALFLFLFSFFAFILASKRRGLFIGLFVVIYLLLRMNHLTHPFFLIMLLVLFGCLELFFVKRS